MAALAPQIRNKIDALVKQLSDQQASFAAEANRIQAQIDEMKQALTFVLAHPEADTIVKILARLG